MTYTLKRPICRKCGAVCEPGMLLAHEKAMHPRPAPVATKPRVCRRKGCLEVYGPKGHVVGREGPCAY